MCFSSLLTGLKRDGPEGSKFPTVLSKIYSLRIEIFPKKVTLEETCNCIHKRQKQLSHNSSQK